MLVLNSNNAGLHIRGNLHKTRTCNITGATQVLGNRKVVTNCQRKRVIDNSCNWKDNGVFKAIKVNSLGGIPFGFWFLQKTPWSRSCLAFLLFLFALFFSQDRNNQQHLFVTKCLLSEHLFQFKISTLKLCRTFSVYTSAFYARVGVVRVDTFQ